MTHIHVIHENAAWLEPLAAALDRRALPWRDWFLDRGVFDLSRPPPEGVFYNRMSASSHTRDHRYAAELTAAVLAWLERHGRRVVNGGRALDLEISKARQYAALEAAGIRTPDTVLVAGTDARRYGQAALGGRPFHPQAEPRRQGARRATVHTAGCPGRLSGQPGLRPAGRRPSSAAAIRPRPAAADHSRRVRRRPLHVRGRGRHQRRLRAVPGRCLRRRRRILPGGRRAARQIHHHRRHRPGTKAPLRGVPGRQRHRRRRHRVHHDADGALYTYDVNTNTNYNPDAEARAGRSGMDTLACLLGNELALSLRSS